jgi:hypothetical protein
MTGKVVKRLGRPTDFSKRLDGLMLLAALQHLGSGYREAEAAVQALLGVDKGELSRARSSGIEPGQSDPLLYGVAAIRRYRNLINSRLSDPNTGAAAALASLPASGRNWFTTTLS